MRPVRVALLLPFLLAVLGAPLADHVPGAEARALVDTHNRLRARHCAPPLRWSPKVAASAERWAQTLQRKGCALQHSGGPYGENLAGGTHGAMTPDAVVEMWYAEVKGYAFKRGGFSPKTGHFTQLVWRGTSELGCAKAECGSQIDLWVCQYAPPGNVEGGYHDNVQPIGCK